MKKITITLNPIVYYCIEDFDNKEEIINNAIEYYFMKCAEKIYKDAHKINLIQNYKNNPDDIDENDIQDVWEKNNENGGIMYNEDLGL